MSFEKNVSGTLTQGKGPFTLLLIYYCMFTMMRTTTTTSTSMYNYSVLRYRRDMTTGGGPGADEVCN